MRLDGLQSVHSYMMSLPWRLSDCRHQVHHLAAILSCPVDAVGSALHICLIDVSGKIPPVMFEKEDLSLGKICGLMGAVATLVAFVGSSESLRSAWQTPLANCSSVQSLAQAYAPAGCLVEA